MEIPEVGRLLFGLKPAASYKAAARGDFPVITSGRRKVVPTGLLRQMLGMDGGDRRGEVRTWLHEGGATGRTSADARDGPEAA